LNFLYQIFKIFSIFSFALILTIIIVWLPEQEMQKQNSGSGTADGGEGQGQGNGQSSADKLKRLLCGWLSAAKVIREWHVTSKNIDRMSRRVFPIGFLIFNVLFWFIYVVIYPDEHSD
jgi:hypothetical protein